MPIEKAEIFNIKDLTLDVRLQAIVDGETRDFTGKKTFSVEFFKKNIGFGITDVEIEVNTSLQPIITITFKDLYGNTVFGKSLNKDPDLSNENSAPDFSVLFNWPPPKFLFTFKGFLGKSASWMLSMKKTSVSYDSSDGSYNIKCEFVPNQWGFFSDLPFLYLLAVKSLKKKDGLSDDQFRKVQTIFDLIKIGKQVEVKTTETTKEFDGLLKKMTLLKSKRVYDALFVSKVVNYNEEITGQVGNQTIVEFKPITIDNPNIIKVGNEDIDTMEKIASKSSSPNGLIKLNEYLLLSSHIGGMKPVVGLTFKQYSAENSPDLSTQLASRLSVISENIINIENAIKKKTYESSKDQLEKITIGEIFRQLAEDSGYIMGKILEAGYQGYEQNISSRDGSLKNKLIGKSFPLWINEKNEEKPASKLVTGSDFGIETNELKFVNDFIDSISEGIASELAEDSSSTESVGNNLIKNRISNIEALKSNPYKPFYQSIAENIMIRGGVAAYLIRSSDPNYPGDYDTFLGFDRATNAEDIGALADADFENITESIIKSLSEDEFLKLKTFCVFWDNLLTDDCRSIRMPSIVNGENGKLIKEDSIGQYLNPPGVPLSDTIMNYPVVIERPAQWDGQNYSATGLQTKTLKEIMESIFRPRPNIGSTSSLDASNSSFINLSTLQSSRVVNNGIAYFKLKGAIGGLLTSYVYVKFDGPDANKTQSVTSSKSDAKLKNDAEEQKNKKEPLGYVNIQSNKDDEDDELQVISGMNERIKSGLLLDYSKLTNPSTDFYNNPSLNDINDYFIVSNTLRIGDADTNIANEIQAKNIAVSVAYNSNNSNDLVFGPFVSSVGLTFNPLDSTDKDSLTHRGYIKRVCVKLLDRIKSIEQKRNQVISDVLGKAEEQKDALYKQMHVLYQQWEVLIIKDSEYLGCNSSVPSSKGLAKGTVAKEIADRYKGKEHHINLDIPQKISEEAADNTFIYAYPLNFFPENKKINVKNSIINIDTLYKPNGNTTVLNIIQQICTKNNFIFIPMPGDSGAFSISDIFSTHPIDSPKIKNFFYVQFAPTPESRSTLRNDNNIPLSSSQDFKKNITLDALELKFGSPENQIVKNITVDTSESKATAESIINLQRLVDNENQNKKVTTDCSMLPVMEGRSYKVTAEMLGNAQVFPMQFFYLDSMPLFNGLYQIMKVKHSIKPNDMTTSAEGIRMRMDFQTGKFGGIPPVTLETLEDLPVTLLESSNLTQENFNAAIADAGTAEDSAYAPQNSVSTMGIILLPTIKGVGNSIRLTQSTDSNGKIAAVHDIAIPPLSPIKKEDIIQSMNEFISDVLEPFSLFLKNTHPELYKNWWITSSMRGHVPAGGSVTSQHLYGQAIDSQIVNGANVTETMKSNLKLLNAILEWYQLNPNVKYDQILWETRTPSSSWIHWSYKRNNSKLDFRRFVNDNSPKRTFEINTHGKYLLPGVTEQQIHLSMV